MPEMNPDEHMLQLMELIEVIDTQALVAGTIATMPLEAVNQQDWTIIQENMKVNCELLNMLKQSISIGSKLADNPAVMSHMINVIEAE